MDTAITIVTLGLVTGSQYALYAAGLGLVMYSIRVLNLAHGLVFVAGAYGLYFLAAQFVFPPGIMLPLGVLVGAVCGALAMMAISVFGLRPAMKSGRSDDINMALITVAFGTAGVSAVQLFVGSEPLAIGIPTVPLFQIGSLTVSVAQLLTIALAAVCMVGLFLVLNRSAVGRRLRALADSESDSALVGVNAPRYVMYAMMTAGALAGIAGALGGAVNGLASPNIGNDLLVKGSAIIVLGGVGSVMGSVLIAYGLGIVEVLVAYTIGGVYAGLVALVAMILVLRFRPNGIFGRPELQRM